MKRISFKIAKVLRDAGYPQENCDEYLNKYGAIDCYLGYNTARPTYLEVWLWLWREKKIAVYAEECLGKWGVFELNCNVSRKGYVYTDPEEAIIEGIDYLCDNNLIK